MGNVLSIFDFDDTLIKSTARVRVIHGDGSEDMLSTEEYAEYTPRPDDEFDYSEFDAYPPGAEPIDSTFGALNDAIQQYGIENIVILTARAADKPVRMYLQDQGLSGIDIQAIGDSAPKAKAQYVMSRLKTGDYDLVHVYEDNANNIRAIKRVVTDSGIKFQSTLVAESRSYLKEFIKNILREDKMSIKITKKKLPDGAGVIVVKKIDEEWKVLGLRLYGKYDIPKGEIEDNEDTFSTAIRETEEEASITDLNFRWGKEPIVITGKANITVYLAETTQDPAVKKNPHTGIFEHHAAAWCCWDFMEERVYDYLKPAITWARGVVNDS